MMGRVKQASTFEINLIFFVDSLGGVVVSSLVIPKTLIMVEMAAPLSAQGCGVSITTDWLVSGLMDHYNW